MSEFDKHWDTHCISSNCEEDEAKIHFEAGQQSKQAEIDALKSKIQTALNKACMLQNSNGERIYTELKEILK